MSKSFGRSIVKMLKETEHGKILTDNGFDEDIDYCAKLNINEAVPYFSGNVLKLLPADIVRIEEDENKS